MRNKQLLGLLELPGCRQERNPREVREENYAMVHNRQMGSIPANLVKDGHSLSNGFCNSIATREWGDDDCSEWTQFHHHGRRCTLGTKWRNPLRNVRWIRCPLATDTTIVLRTPKSSMVETETTPCDDPLTAQTVGADLPEGRGRQEIQVLAGNPLGTTRESNPRFAGGR